MSQSPSKRTFKSVFNSEKDVDNSRFDSLGETNSIMRENGTFDTENPSTTESSDVSSGLLKSIHSTSADGAQTGYTQSPYDTIFSIFQTFYCVPTNTSTNEPERKQGDYNKTEKMELLLEVDSYDSWVESMQTNSNESFGAALNKELRYQSSALTDPSYESIQTTAESNHDRIPTADLSDAEFLEIIRQTLDADTQRSNSKLVNTAEISDKAFLQAMRDSFNGDAMNQKSSELSDDNFLKALRKNGVEDIGSYAPAQPLQTSQSLPQQSFNFNVFNAMIQSTDANEPIVELTNDEFMLALRQNGVDEDTDDLVKKPNASMAFSNPEFHQTTYGETDYLSTNNTSNFHALEALRNMGDAGSFAATQGLAELNVFGFPSKLATIEEVESCYSQTSSATSFLGEPEYLHIPKDMTTIGKDEIIVKTSDIFITKARRNDDDLIPDMQAVSSDESDTHFDLVINDTPNSTESRASSNSSSIMNKGCDVNDTAFASAANAADDNETNFLTAVGDADTTFFSTVDDSNTRETGSYDSLDDFMNQAIEEEIEQEKHNKNDPRDVNRGRQNKAGDDHVGETKVNSIANLIGLWESGKASKRSKSFSTPKPNVHDSFEKLATTAVSEEAKTEAFRVKSESHELSNHDFMQALRQHGIDDTSYNREPAELMHQSNLDELSNRQHGIDDTNAMPSSTSPKIIPENKKLVFQNDTLSSQEKKGRIESLVKGSRIDRTKNLSENIERMLENRGLEKYERVQEVTQAPKTTQDHVDASEDGMASSIDPSQLSMRVNVKSKKDRHDFSSTLLNKKLGKQLINGWKQISTSCPDCSLPLMINPSARHRAIALCVVCGSSKNISQCSQVLLPPPPPPKLERILI